MLPDASPTVPDRTGHIELLDLTPEEYRDYEFYFALCDDNDKGTMKLVPEHFRNDNLLADLIVASPHNIRCFTNDALERTLTLTTAQGTERLTCWQIALLKDGEAILYLELNYERIKFFMAHYPKYSSEYEYCFKSRYKTYRKKQYEAANPQSRHSSSHNEASMASLLTLALAFSGASSDEAIDTASEMSRRESGAGSNARLPIHYEFDVPMRFREELDRDEYIIAIYKQLGIELNEFDSDNYYYNVKLPEGFKITESKRFGYELRNKDDVIILTFDDLGPFYDRDVFVRQIYIELDPAIAAEVAASHIPQPLLN